MIALLRAGLPLGLAVLEFCWLYPWVLLTTGAFYGPVPVPLLPPTGALLMLAGGFVAVRETLARPWPLPTVRATVVGVGLLIGLAVVKTTYYPAVPAYDLRWIGTLLP
jgi:hypothetical protein